MSVEETERRLADVDPHVVQQTPGETDGEFVRFESTLYPVEGERAGTDLTHEPWSLDYAVEHLHPDQRERWEVLEGELRVEWDDQERTLTEGEEVWLPADTAHRHFNPADEPARIVWERHPAYRDDEWAESLFALAQAGEVDEDGVPDPLQLAVITDEYEHESVYLSGVPVGLQKVGFSVLAAVGRAAGYEARHTRADVADD